MISNFLCSWLEWAEAKQLLFSIFAVPPQRSSLPAYDLPRRKLFRQPYRRLSRFPENKNHIDPGLTHCLPGSFFCGSHRLSFHLPPGLLLPSDFDYEAFTLYGGLSQNPSSIFQLTFAVHYPGSHAIRFRLFPFRSPLLRKSMFLSLPPGT